MRKLVENAVKSAFKKTTGLQNTLLYEPKGTYDEASRSTIPSSENFSMTGFISEQDTVESEDQRTVKTQLFRVDSKSFTHGVSVEGKFFDQYGIRWRIDSIERGYVTTFELSSG